MTQTYDAIVIGAGAMGSAVAYHLSQRRQRVLLLEQFELDHRKGSSYGYSRIIRYSYDFPEYVELAKDAFPLWSQMEAELGETVYFKTGGIDFGPATDPTLQATIAAVRTSGIPHDLLSPAEAQRRFPQFCFDDDFQALHQPDSGFITASKAVRGHLKLARSLGATILDNTAVTEIRLNSDSIEVAATDAVFSAGKLILTAGAWARTLLAQTGISLPLQPLRCQLNFMAPPNMNLFDAARCPVWIAHVSQRFPTTIYGIPSHAGSGFKIAFHGGPPLQQLAAVNYSPDADNVETLRPFMRAHIPGIAAAPVRESRICLYTQTPDEHFIVDAHPAHQHVVIGAGFSGHGFKFSPLIGKMLADIALEGATPHQARLFKIARFLN